MTFYNVDLSNQNSEQKVPTLSVSSLNRMAKGLLESNFPAIVVEGEVSNLATPASGHWYLTLKDKNSQIRCAMFAGRNRSVKFRPKNGNQVIIRGKLSIYEGRGDYQLIADSMEEEGDGALRRAFEKLKEKLQNEGLFNIEHKQKVFSCFEHVGVVTSATGAAIQDILSVFGRRFPATKITLFPAAVQGLAAPNEIINAIQLANKLQAKIGVQALIVGRGGGSLEDLQAFNEESVARAIFSSTIPIVSAVGHEVDFTIADFTADLRAPTPSAAAELMSPDQQDYFASLTAYRSDLYQKLNKTLSQAKNQIQWLARQLKRSDRRLQEHAQNLDRLENQMQLATKNKITLRQSDLKRIHQGMMSNSPSSLIKQRSALVESVKKEISLLIKSSIQKTKSQIVGLSRSLSAVSPLDTLARGYSITYDDSGKVIDTANSVKPGSQIISHLHKGRIKSSVESILPDDK